MVQTVKGKKKQTVTDKTSFAYGAPKLRKVPPRPKISYKQDMRKAGYEYQRDPIPYGNQPKPGYIPLPNATKNLGVIMELTPYLHQKRYLLQDGSILVVPIKTRTY